MPAFFLENLPYFLTLGASLSFSSSSLIFSHYSRELGVFWMNVLKASVAFLLLIPTLIVVLTVTQSAAGLPRIFDYHPPQTTTVLGLLLSGALGLGIGDLFLLDAFRRLGVSRTLILYGFQPIVIGIGSFILFGQTVSTAKAIGILCLILCLFVFSLEKYYESKRWDFKGLIIALIGVSFDISGVLITRWSFDLSPATHALEGHMIRCVGALLSYLMILLLFRNVDAESRWARILSIPQNLAILPRLKALTHVQKSVLFVGCFGGTYLSLCLYLTAVQIGHLASISALAIAGPLFSTLLEAIIYKKRPNLHLISAFILFAGGLYCLVIEKG